MHDFYDLIVIGAGSGGVRASRMAAASGARVLVCEKGALGGTCVNVGCIPKKLLVYGSHFRDVFDDAVAYGWASTRPAFDWATLIARKDREIERLNGVYGRLLEQAGVHVVRGTAQVIGPHDVQVGEDVFRGQKILVAVGGRPFVPDFPGREFVLTSDDFFRLPALPERVVVLGGGYIAVELAGILQSFGSQVTLCHRGERLLRGFDEELRTVLEDEIAKRGIELRLHASVRHVEHQPGGYRVVLHDGEALDADVVFAATGRIPLTSELGLASLGVSHDDLGAIVVDDSYQTSVPSIYALGDVCNRVQLTPVALAEAMRFVHLHFGAPSRPVIDYAMIPTAVFSQPPVATVGLSEEQAHAQGRSLRIYRSSFTPLLHTLTGRNEKTWMKLVVDDESDRVLGCHMIGADAAEIIQGFAVALTCGATKAQFDATIGIHPTAAEEFVTMRTPAPSKFGEGKR